MKAKSVSVSGLELLRYKEFIAQQRFADAEVVSETFAQQVVEACKAVDPFVMVFDDILGPRVKREHSKH